MSLPLYRRPGCLVSAASKRVGMSNAGLHLHAELEQLSRHQFGCAELAVAKLRVLVNVSSPGYDLIEHAIGFNLDGI